MEVIISGISWLDDFVWGMPMIALLLDTHLFMTVCVGFIQRKTFTGIRLSVYKDPEAPDDVSQFQALITTLASTIDAGNIIGVDATMLLGGPGAVFWYWLADVFGIATKYVESPIATKYQIRTPDGRVQGGTICTLERGLNLKQLEALFAALTALVSFGISYGIQINTIAEAIENNISAGIPPIAIGVVGGLLIDAVIIDDIQSIVSMCEKPMPFMAVFYVLGCIIVLAINWDSLAPAVSTILRLIFIPGAAMDGLVRQGLMATMRFGMARGLFSNESSMGSAPLVASAAQTHNPVRQALISATGTFRDIVMVCFTAGSVLVTTIMKNPATGMAQIFDGGQLITLTFVQIPILGPIILVVDIITFAWSTTLDWSYYGERCAQYLQGKRVLLPYKLIFVTVMVVGLVLILDLVWTIADILNALMAIPGLVAVLLSSGVIAWETRHYLGNLDEVDQTEISRVDK